MNTRQSVFENDNEYVYNGTLGCVLISQEHQKLTVGTVRYICGQLFYVARCNESFFQSIFKKKCYYIDWVPCLTDSTLTMDWVRTFRDRIFRRDCKYDLY